MRRLIITLIVLFCLTSLGYGVWVSARAHAELRSRPAPGKVRIEPSELFDDATRKLEPHLGLWNTCVLLTHNQQKAELGVGYQVWRDGKLVLDMSRAFRGFGSDLTRAGYSAEVSIIFDQTSDGDIRASIGMHGERSRGHTQPTAEMPEEINDSLVLLAKIRQSRTFPASDPFPIAAYLGSRDALSGPNVRSGETPLEAAKRADWAFVIVGTLKERESSVEPVDDYDEADASNDVSTASDGTG